MSTKNDLRNKLKNQRRSLSLKEVMSYSRVIIQKLGFIQELKIAEYIHIYYPIEKEREINTLTLIRCLIKSGRKVVLPRVVSTTELHQHQIYSLDDLTTSKIGIIEPLETCPIINEAKLDLIIVPMLGGDLSCYRLGFGGGFYDRMLAKTDAAKVGLCYDFGIVETIFPEKHDIPLDKIITERKTLERVEQSINL